MLIAEYWQTGEPLPDDDGILAKLAGLTRAKWKAIRATLAAMFDVADGYWVHKRIESELVAARLRYEKRAGAGRNGGLAKAQHSSSNATAMHKQVQEQSTEKKEQEGLRILKGVSKRLSGAESDWTPEQRKAAWQTKICREAQRIMPDADYAKWLIAWANGEPWAKRKAEEVNAMLEAGRERASA